jgi:hypothetical protein
MLTGQDVLEGGLYITTVQRRSFNEAQSIFCRKVLRFFGGDCAEVLEIGFVLCRAMKLSCDLSRN